MTRARPESRGLRARVDTRHADTAKDKRTGRRVGPRPVPKRPAAHSRAMVVLAHRDSSHMPFPSCSKLHTRTHSQARTHGASNCQRGIYVSLPCERAHAATPSASQHVSKHPTGRHGSGGIPAASGRGPSASPRQSRCVIMPPRCPPDASVVRPSCGASLGRSPSKQ